MVNPTDIQMKALAIIPVITGSASILGSLTVIYIILRSHLKLTTTYHRLAFALAFCDVFQSTSQALSSFPVPKGTPDVIYAMGTQLTCNIQGFVNTFGGAALALYFCGLTGYFLMAIKFGLSDEIISTYYEPLVHIISIGYSLVGAIFTLFYSGYFTSGNGCWIAPRPIHCDSDPSIECESGSDFNKLRWIFAAGPSLFSFVIITTNMLIIFYTLLCQNSSTGLTSLGRESTTRALVASNIQTPYLEAVGENPPSSTTSRMERRDSVMVLYAASKKKRKASKAEQDRKEGMIQALLYIFTFIICYIFTFLYHAFDGLDQKSYIGLFVLNKIFYPLQGFFICFIFIRPRVMNAKRRKPSLSTYQAFVEAIQSRGEKVKTRRRRVSSRSMRRLNQSQQRSVAVSFGVPPSPRSEAPHDGEGGDGSKHIPEASSSNRRSSRVSFSDMNMVLSNLEEEIDRNDDDQDDIDANEDKDSDSVDNDEDNAHDVEDEEYLVQDEEYLVQDEEYLVQDEESGSDTGSSSDGDGFVNPLLSFNRRLSAEMISRSYTFGPREQDTQLRNSL